MNSRPVLVTAGLLLGLATAATALGKPMSDLVSPERRRAIVEQAQRLTHPADPTPLPTELAHPFNPPNFEKPDPEEVRAAAARATSPGTSPGGTSPAGPGAPVAALRPAGDREILENIAAKILPTGTIMLGGEPLLIFGRKNVKIGSHFTVTNSANGQDYELELIAIDRTTFTLRYRNEEITRPIKTGKSP